MAANKALSQLDILTAIVSCVQEQETLATLARVSHTLSNIALDKLWRACFNVIALARCMPQQYWKEVESSYESYPGATSLTHDSILELTDVARTGDWLGPRFRTYAARITQLHTQDLSARRRQRPMLAISSEEVLSSTAGAGQEPENVFVKFMVHQEVFRAWDCFSHDIMPLFPNLRSLSWRARRENDWTSMRTFVAPSLTYLSIIADGSVTSPSPGKPPPFDGQTLTDILEKVISSCALFSSLRLTVDEGLMAGLEQHSSHLPLHVLRHFHTSVWPVPSNLVRRVATWPHLRTFSATLPIDLKPFSNNAAGLFPHLEILRLKGSSVESLKSIWRGVQSDRVHTLELSPSHELLPSQLLGLLKHIVVHPSSQSLREVSFNRSLDLASRRSGARQTSSEVEENMLFEVVHPLVLRLSNLESLSLGQEIRYPYIFPSPGIRHMLEAWPNVKYIHIVNNTPERIALADFLNLVRDRPLLRTITGFEVDVLIDDPPPETREWQHQHLENIQFVVRGSSESTENRITLVHHLLTSFPRISARCIQGDGAMRMFAFRAIRARKSGTPWCLDDYQQVLTGIAKAVISDPEKQPFTGHYTEDGKPVLCYARAVFNPVIWTSGEVHDERKLHLSDGDIVAVTAKQESGKWTGVLLDEHRYNPSNDSFWGDPAHVEVI